MSSKRDIDLLINRLIDGFNLKNKAGLARILGISPQTISSWISRGNIDYDLIYAKCEGVDANWLLTGEGNMLKVPEKVYCATVQEPVSPYLSGSGKNKNMPLIPVSAIAGFTNGDVSILDKDVIEHYQIPEFEDKADFLVHVTGDSMTPLLQHGNLIACKKIYDSHFIQWGKVHLLDTSQGPVVKRLYQDQDAAALLCVSENKDLYPPFKMLRSEVRSLFIVVGVVKSL